MEVDETGLDDARRIEHRRVQAFERTAVTSVHVDECSCPANVPLTEPWRCRRGVSDSSPNRPATPTPRLSSTTKHRPRPAPIRRPSNRRQSTSNPPTAVEQFDLDRIAAYLSTDSTELE